MAGKKSIVLLNQRGQPIGTRRRYKKLPVAVARAMELCFVSKLPIQIWHLDEGAELAMVKYQLSEVRLYIHRPRSFKQVWSRT